MASKFLKHLRPHQAKIADLTDTIDTLTKELAEHQAEVDETKLQMKRAGEDREAENAESQPTCMFFSLTPNLPNARQKLAKVS